MIRTIFSTRPDCGGPTWVNSCFLLPVVAIWRLRCHAATAHVRQTRRRARDKDRPSDSRTAQGYGAAKACYFTVNSTRIWRPPANHHGKGKIAQEQWSTGPTGTNHDRTARRTLPVPWNPIRSVGSSVIYPFFSSYFPNAHRQRYRSRCGAVVPRDAIRLSLQLILVLKCI